MTMITGSGRSGHGRFFLLFILITLVVAFFSAKVEAEENNRVTSELGVLETGSGSKGSKRFCVQCYTSTYQFAGSAETAAKFPHSAIQGLQQDACQLTTMSSDEDIFVLAVPKNCSLNQMISNVEKLEGLGLLLSSPVKPVADASALFPVAAFVGGDQDVEAFLKIVQESPDQEMAIFVPFHGRFDLSLLVIFAIAMGTIACGSYWSGITMEKMDSSSKDLYEAAAPEANDGQRQNDNDPANGRTNNSNDERTGIVSSNRRANEDAYMKMSISFVVCLVLVMCSTLILLYFFYSYLVYVIIGLFSLASTIGLYECSVALVGWTANRFWPNCSPVQLPACNLYFCKVSLKLHELALLLMSLAVVAVWLVFRNSDWAWGLRNFLGFLFCINMLRVCLLPSLKICTILMSILFFYDIFFVFITPLFTPNGESIMVEVATGGSTSTTASESLPLVFGVPRISNDFSACGQVFSMLGFGDVMIPGMFLSFCHGFDIMAKTPFKCYWVISLLCYGLGLGVTFVSLALMNTGQPALLYLVPFTLVPIFITAYCRKELGPMWRGDFENEAQPEQKQIEGPIDQENGVNGAENENEPEVEVVTTNPLQPTKDLH